MRDISITSTTIPSKNSRVETQNETKDYSWLAIFKLTPQKFPNLHASLITEHGDHTQKIDFRYNLAHVLHWNWATKK